MLNSILFYKINFVKLHSFLQHKLCYTPFLFTTFFFFTVHHRNFCYSHFFLQHGLLVNSNHSILPKGPNRFHNSFSLTIGIVLCSTCLQHGLYIIHDSFSFSLWSLGMIKLFFFLSHSRGCHTPFLFTTVTVSHHSA